jgi:hypothetical protein
MDQLRVDLDRDSAVGPGKIALIKAFCIRDSRSYSSTCFPGCRRSCSLSSYGTVGRSNFPGRLT